MKSSNSMVPPPNIDKALWWLHTSFPCPTIVAGLTNLGKKLSMNLNNLPQMMMKVVWVV
jgi:hypothetical protein